MFVKERPASKCRIHVGTGTDTEQNFKNNDVGPELKLIINEINF
jgi:hypothetical protein